MRVFGSLLVVALSVLIVGYAYRDLDLARLFACLGALGAGGVLVFVPQFVGLALESWGWQNVLGALGHRTSFVVLCAIRFATEAVGQVLPGGVMVGESLKPALLDRHLGLSLATGIGATIHRKYVRLLAHGLYVFGAAVLAFPALEAASKDVLGTRGLGLLLLGAGLGLFVAALGLSLWMGGGRTALRILAGLRRLPFSAARGWARAAHRKVGRTDREMTRFFSLPTGATALPVVLCLGAWVTEALESCLLLHLLGFDVSLPLFVGLDVSLSLLRQLLFFLPAGIGVQEAGYLFVLSVLGVPDPLTTGAAFALVKRSKELVGVVVGFGFWGWLERARARVTVECVASAPALPLGS